jgi:aryl-alcohol dehydrogenase-like predicted oxidoreductase
MEQRQFGNTALRTSAVGFGAWGIGGPAMAAGAPIGWGDVDDPTSIRALERARECGITFFDTADFYGLGHSEELLGRVFGNRDDIVVATKVGHRLSGGGSIILDYSRGHILRACDASLRRLRRETIDFYQLHSARREHLEQGECVEAMELLREKGKIRFWGLSLNTFRPWPEAEYMITRKLGHGFQCVLNIINQRAIPLLSAAAAAGYGLIARMPLQFGLLTGKFNAATRFPSNDHRSFRLPGPFLERAAGPMKEVQAIAERLGISGTTLALSFCSAFPEVSTVIPGIRTPAQAEANSTLVTLPANERELLCTLYRDQMEALVAEMEKAG